MINYNVFTVKQVAKYLKVCERTVTRLIHDKKLKASKVGGSWRIQEKDINKYLNTYTNYRKEI